MKVPPRARVCMAARGMTAGQIEEREQDPHWWPSCVCGNYHMLMATSGRLQACYKPECHPPTRVRLLRLTGFRLPTTARSVARPTRWGNPYRVGTELNYYGPVSGRYCGAYAPKERALVDLAVPGGLTQGQAVALYRQSLEENLADPDPVFDQLRTALAGLAGWDLACWCKAGEPCHADVLLHLANRSD